MKYKFCKSLSVFLLLGFIVAAGSLFNTNRAYG
ncbi:MAG: hypothetical protein A4E53_01086 [Pelotomaculum sp. PtaB.Bin104]|nr:MAG: hypothetical protein A4E53_01086 [Pelotomaculum sp. PtaB.Bin104]